MTRRISRDVSLLMEDPGRRVGITRRPLVRIYEIHSAILEGDYPNCSVLARKLSVQRKTIQRDITFMRDELRLPLVYDEALHGYYYDRDVSDFPVFQTTAEELAGLFLARQALESVRGTSLAEVLGNVFSKLTRGMLGQIDLTWSDLDETFSRKTIQQDPRNIKRFGQIAESILNQSSVSFYYRKLGADVSEPRKVHPLHLGEVDGGWYLIAHDTQRDALRTFALPRISRLRISNIRFDRPEDFNGRSHLNRTFGIWHVAGDDTRHLVRVELRGYAARLVQERRWHPTQEMEPLNATGSRVELRFEVGRLEEIMRWVLGFGSHARVIGPPELVRMVKEEIKAMAGS